VWRLSVRCDAAHLLGLSGLLERFGRHAVLDACDAASIDAEALADLTALPRSRSALADVLHGPYPPDARPAYLRAVHLLIVFGTIYMHLKLLDANSLYKSSFMKDLATRCSLHFCKMQSLGCEHACLIFGQAIPSAFIVGAINGLNAVLFYVPVIAWIVGS